MITILNFDNTYEKQEHLKNDQYNWIDFQSTENTNLFCEWSTLQHIEDKLQSTSETTINLIGSGNYHYLTYLFLKRITKPFTLLLFDHHTDTLKSLSEDLISCGSWVLDALHDLPNLEKVLIIGVSEEGEDHIDPSIEGKIRLYSKHAIRLHPKKALKSMLNNINTEEVYISIDKDVLSTVDAVTTWDHGNMRLRQLLSFIKEIIEEKTVSGIDICGEYPIRPNNEFEKHVLEANQKNSDANRFLIHYLAKWLEQTDHTTAILHA